VPIASEKSHPKKSAHGRVTRRLDPKSLMGYAEMKGRVCAGERSDDSLHQISPTERRRWLKQRQSANHCGEGSRLGGQIFDHEVGGYSVAADFRGKLFIGEASEDPRSHESSEGAEPLGSRDIVFDAIANTENIARVLNLGQLHSRQINLGERLADPCHNAAQSLINLGNAPSALGPLPYAAGISLSGLVQMHGVPRCAAGRS
jgi:hypothetical protein